MEFKNVLAEGGAGTASHAEFWIADTRFSKINGSIMVEYNGKFMDIVKFFKMRAIDKGVDSIFKAILRNPAFNKYFASDPRYQGNPDRSILAFISQVFPEKGGKWDVTVKSGETTYDSAEIQKFVAKKERENKVKDTAEPSHAREYNCASCRADRRSLQ